MDPDRAPTLAASRDTSRFPPPDPGGTPSGPGDAPLASAAKGLWVLESCLDGDGSLQRTPIQPLPFRIGRSGDAHLVLPSNRVSKHHAEIDSDGTALRVRDLDSRNGTFVNRVRIGEAVLREGDILHFGDFEFRLARDRDDQLPDAEGTLLLTGPLSQHFRAGPSLVPRLIEEGAVTMFFQPIVTLPGAKRVAYEALGRGRMEGLPENPVELFDLADSLGPDTQAELSRLFRRKAVELVRGLPEPPVLFLNTHPVELERPGLLESLEELRSFAPQVDLVLEIHESTAQTDFISWLRGRLLEINVGLAYDDFGAIEARSRLFDIAEAPPAYLKFDRKLVSGLDHAPNSRQRLVAALVAVARELLVKSVAEGIETPEEAAACVAAGFSHAQGYHFGRPGPVETVA